MLERSGDLIPVKPEAVYIPWTRRKAQVLSLLHRGKVDFLTHVYDTNVGDISPLYVYFNPCRWTVEDLNEKFALGPSNCLPVPDGASGVSPGSTNQFKIKDTTTGREIQVQVQSLQPRLIVYPEESEENDDDIESEGEVEDILQQATDDRDDEHNQAIYDDFTAPPSCSSVMIKHIPPPPPLKQMGNLYSKRTSKHREDSGGGSSVQTAGTSDSREDEVEDGNEEDATNYESEEMISSCPPSSSPSRGGAYYEDEGGSTTSGYASGPRVPDTTTLFSETISDQSTFESFHLPRVTLDSAFKDVSINNDFSIGAVVEKQKAKKFHQNDNQPLSPFIEDAGPWRNFMASATASSSSSAFDFGATGTEYVPPVNYPCFADTYPYCDPATGSLTWPWTNGMKDNNSIDAHWKPL